MKTIEPLSGIDALFLHIETEQMPMHVGSMHLYDVAPRLRRGYLARVRKSLSQRLHLSPVFTRRLVQAPLHLTNPMWVREPEIDITYHVRGVQLPAPGTVEQFEDCVADLHSRLMDRTRPLWEIYVIQGLADGSTGVYCKVHHAAIDGKAGVVLARAMLDLEPNPPPIPQPASGSPGGEPATTTLLKTALASQARLSARLIKLIPGLLKVGSHAAGDAIGSRLQSLVGAKRRRADGLPVFAPRTLLNGSIDGERALAGTSVPLADLKRIAAALGGTVNDTVLAICSGGLRRYLEAHDALPDRSLLAAIPVSLRAEGDESLNTQATMLRTSLATDLEDPRERYDAVRASSARMKQTAAETRSVIPMDFPSLGMPWLLPGLASLYERAHVADRVDPVVNLVISNVPGPQVPLYMSGARMLTYYPLSIVTHGFALNITVESYNGTLYFGLAACRRALPDLRSLAACIEEARDELLSLAQATAQPQPGRSGRAAKKPAKPRAGKPSRKPAA